MVNDFVQFCERLETMENEEKRKHDFSTKSTKSTRLNKVSKKEKKKGRKKGLNYLVHGENYGHTSDQCFVLKKQAKRLKQGTRPSNKHDTNYAEVHTDLC